MTERTIVVRVPLKLYQAAADCANRQEQNISQVVRMALRQYVEGELVTESEDK